MYRIRMTLPKRKDEGYRNLDMLHDALINALAEAGASPEEVIGMNARLWNFAPLGWRRGNESRVHTLVVCTPDPVLTGYLEKIDPAKVCHSRPETGEEVDFSSAEILVEPDPVVPGQTALGVVMLSPLAVSRRDGSGKKWHNNLNDFDLTAAANHRLSRLAGRTVALRVEPDRLYLRGNPKHDTLVQTKEFTNGKRDFVIGIRAPLILQGSDEDLRLAWYAGIGEKTRYGFGCVGLAERGIGR